MRVDRERAALTVGDMVRKRLLTSGQVAAELGLSRSAIARYAREGSITPEVITPGGQYRFDLDRVREELRQLAERRRNERRDS